MEIIEKKPRKRSADASQQRRRTNTSNKSAQDVVYTQPESFNRRRFILRLLTVAAVVLALVLGMAIFFKVDMQKSTVSGMQKYTAWDIWEASGIQDGENLLTLNKAKAAGRIREALPYVDVVRIGIKLPDTVKIEITELPVTYSIEAQDGTWWLMSYEGRIVGTTTAAEAGDTTKILGVKVQKPVVGQPAVAVEATPQTDENGQTKPVTVLGSERLAVVVEVLTGLEKYGIIGEAASVDVTDISQIEVWYGQRYQMLLGDKSQLEKKIATMKQVIDQSSDHQTGILSFTSEMVVKHENFS